MNSFDVVVIGGGIIGSSVAYYLSKEGYQVALVEKGDIAAGTSSRCDAVALICDKKPGIDTEIGFRSIQLYKELAKNSLFDFEFFSREACMFVKQNRNWKLQMGMSSSRSLPATI